MIQQKSVEMLGKRTSTELRAILREDLQKVDPRAIQIAEVDISQAHTAVIMKANIANIADLDAMIKKLLKMLSLNNRLLWHQFQQILN